MSSPAIIKGIFCKMTLDDLKKLATGSLLFNLDRIIAPRLITIFYLLGMATISLWAISHFFATFAFGLGSGLWGLLEIVVFGLLGFVALRIACEAAIVYFKANEHTADAVNQVRAQTSLIDEVRDAIEELADEDSEPAAIEPPAATKPAEEKPVTAKSNGKPRRTAKRSPSAKS